MVNACKFIGAIKTADVLMPHLLLMGTHAINPETCEHKQLLTVAARLSKCGENVVLAYDDRFVVLGENHGNELTLAHCC